jgi:hypothetical protein
MVLLIYKYNFFLNSGISGAYEPNTLSASSATTEV